MTTHVPIRSLPVLRTDEFLPPISRWIKFSGLFILGAASLAFAGTTIATYKTTVKATAVIRPVGELRLVQAATEGTVMQIEVTENQTVQQGEVIATLDDSQLQTKKSQLQNNIQQAQLQILQMTAQIHAIDSQMLAESDRHQRTVASSAAELQQRQREYQDRQVTGNAKVTTAAAKLRAARAALSAARLKWQRYAPLANTGAITTDKLEEAELVVQQQTEEVAAAEAELQQAQTELNPSSAAVTIASEQIAQAQAAGSAAIAALQQERESLIQQRIQLQTQLAQDRQSLRQVEIDLTRTTITATADGVIAKLKLRNSNQTVAAGQEIAQIVPRGARLVVKAWVAAQDIDKVKVGQRSQLRVSACPYPDYGTLDGTVQTISPDAIVPPASEDAASGAAPAQPTAAPPAYEVTIEPATLVLQQRQQQCRIQPGMEGRVDIISREETVLKTILRTAKLIIDF